MPAILLLFNIRLVKETKGALHEFMQMVNLRVNHLVKCRRIARDANPLLKLT